MKNKMKARKNKVLSVLTLIVALILCAGLLAACDGENGNGGEPNPTSVTWSNLTANGTPATVTTTELTLTFSVDPTSAFTADNVTVTGATKGELTGTGTTRTLEISAITVANGGDVTVTLTNPTNIVFSQLTRTVAVYVADDGGEPEPTGRFSSVLLYDWCNEAWDTTGYGYVTRPATVEEYEQYLITTMYSEWANSWTTRGAVFNAIGNIVADAVNAAHSGSLSSQLNNMRDETSIAISQFFTSLGTEELFGKELFVATIEVITSDLDVFAFYLARGTSGAGGAPIIFPGIGLTGFRGWSTAVDVDTAVTAIKEVFTTSDFALDPGAFWFETVGEYDPTEEVETHIAMLQSITYGFAGDGSLIWFKGVLDGEEQISTYYFTNDSGEIILDDLVDEADNEEFFLFAMTWNCCCHPFAIMMDGQSNIRIDLGHYMLEMYVTYIFTFRE